MMFRNRKLVRNRRSPLASLTCTADFTQQADFRLHQRPDLTSENTLTGTAWSLLEPSGCVSLPADGVELLIPATEVLRWCYGTSSRVLQAALSQEIGGLLEEIKEGGVLEETLTGGVSAEPEWKYTMTLPQGFPPEDAPLLAWLAQSPVAKKAVEDLRLRIVVGKMRTEQGTCFFPQVSLPYTGQRRVSCLGRYIGEATFLVSRITDLKFSPPFSEVHLRNLGSSLPAEGAARANPGESKRRQRRRVKNAEQITLHSGTEPEDNRSYTRLPGLSSQFTGLVPVLAQGG